MHLPTTFATLGDPTRFAIVERLLKQGETSAGDLQTGLPISPPAVSRHLKILRTNGLIQQRIDQQRRLYSINPQAMQAINAWTITHEEFWNQSLNRLDKALKEIP